MRIAHFYTNTILASWTNLAVGPALQRLGHEVISAPVLTSSDGVVIHNLNPRQQKYVSTQMPSLETLRSCDAILVYGPEYFMSWLNSLYGREAWCSLRMPRVAFYLESTQRTDINLHYDKIHEWFTVHFYPALEDAKRFSGHHVIGCVDTDMFKPCPEIGTAGHQCSSACDEKRIRGKKYDAAFLGTLYAKRAEYFNRQLSPFIKDIDFYTGGVCVKDIGGERHREWAELSAESLRRIKVHVALPSNNSRMTVARPFETMAAGTFLLTYPTDDNLFRDGEHCCFYDPQKPQELAEKIRYYLRHEEEREAIARAGCEEVHGNYLLTKRVEEVLAVIKKHAPAT